MSFKIKGVVKYMDIGTGFWGIIDEKGREFLPLPMPEQLKFAGQTVECKAEKSDAMSMHMWGEAVKIVSFKTITPKKD